MLHEWQWVDEDNRILILTVTTTDEGIIFDVFDELGEQSILTEGMTVGEWIDWMIQRDEERNMA